MIAYRRAALYVSFLLMLSTPCCSHLAGPAGLPSDRRCPPIRVLLDSLRDPAPPVLKGIARVRVESPKQNFSVRELIIAQMPDLLRLETLSPLGQPGFYAAADGRDLYLFVPSENTYYRGEATPRNLNLIIPLNWAVDDVVTVLMGRVPVIDYDDERLRCAMEAGGYALRLEGKHHDTAQVLTFSPDALQVVASEIYQGGSLTCSVSYGDYEATGDIAFPRAIAVFLPADQTTVSINYKKVEFPPEIDSSLFSLSAPQGAKLVPLE